MRKILSLLMILSLLTMSFAIFAEDTKAEDTKKEKITEEITFDGEIEKLTLKEAKDKLLEDNIMLRQLELAIKGQDAKFDEYMSPIYDLKSSPRVKDERQEGSLNNLKLVKLPEVKEQLMLKNAERELIAGKNGLISGLEKAYFSTLQAKDNLIIKKESMELKKELLNQTNQKFDLGLVAKKDVLSAESDYLSAESEYDSALDTFKSAKMELNILLGQEVMKNIELKDKLEKVDFEKVNIEKVINEALEKRYDVLNSKYTYKEANLNFRILQGKYTLNTHKYKQADVNQLVMKKNYDTKIKEVKKEIRNNYMDILTNERKIKSSKKQVELAKEGFRLTKLSYDVGQTTLTQVQEAENKYKLAKLGLSKALLNYNLSVIEFNDSISVGVLSQ